MCTRTDHASSDAGQGCPEIPELPCGGCVLSQATRLSNFAPFHVAPGRSSVSAVRASRKSWRFVGALAARDLRIALYGALMTLAELGSISQQRLARAIGVDPRNVVSIVDSLERRGLTSVAPIQSIVVDTASASLPRDESCLTGFVTSVWDWSERCWPGWRNTSGRR